MQATRAYSVIDLEIISPHWRSYLAGTDQILASLHSHQPALTAVRISSVVIGFVPGLELQKVSGVIKETIRWKVFSWIQHNDRKDKYR